MITSSVNNTEDLRPLLQAPLESPLNMAHTFSRKAEMLTKSKKYDEAMQCHSKAAECLLLAMKSCSSQTMLDSMALQHQSYLSQMERLSTKIQLLDLLDGNQKPTTTVSRSSQTENMQNICTDQYMKVGELLRENDDMIKGYLKASAKDHGNEASDISEKSYKSINLCESDSSDGVGVEKVQSGWKLVGDVSLSCGSEKCHDMLEMNHRLSQCVSSLFNELSSTHAEKKQFEERLCGTGTGDDLTPLAEPALKFSSLNFPPLESLYPEVGPFSSEHQLE